MPYAGGRLDAAALTRAPRSTPCTTTLPTQRRRRGREDPVETRVARSLGLRVERNLAQACADYYLLAFLRRAHYDASAFRALERLVTDLVPELARYLDLACGGELRHASTWPPNLSLCPLLGAGTSRSLAWQQWLLWKNPLERARFAHVAFQEASWPSPNYGGQPWVVIAATLTSYLQGDTCPESFVDRVWNLQHHGGIALNKVYDTDDLALVLEAHGCDNFEVLERHASAPTRKLWQAHCRREARSLRAASESFLLWTLDRGVLEPLVRAAERDEQRWRRAQLARARSRYLSVPPHARIGERIALRLASSTSE